MTALLTALSMWAQAGPSQAGPSPSAWLAHTLRWMFVWGDPSITIDGPWGPPITFVKIVALFSLVGWLAAWALGAVKSRKIRNVKGLDTAAVIAILGCLVSVVLGVLQSTRQIRMIGIGPFSLAFLVAVPFVLVLLAWLERALWVTIGQLGSRTDQVLLGLIHVALAVGFGVGISFAFELGGGGPVGWDRQRLIFGLVLGIRLGLTYMGLVVLARLMIKILDEVFALRPRRLFAIAKLSVIESNRRMWAPWVVLTVFGVILAFTHWFLQPPEQRPAEVGRLYIGTLTLLCSLLITVMVSVLTPISLPQDIQGQTIYTVVSKPVRRLELVWGRMLGFMTLVTVLLALFGGISLLYLWRNVKGTVEQTEARADEVQERDPARARQLREQAEQLRTRMSARKAVKGVLTFLDSKGTPQIKGIDVGQELELRSHIEGATPATAIWEYGPRVADPYDPQVPLNRRLPVEQLLKPGTIEAYENDALMREYGVDAANRGQIQGVSEATKATETAEIQRLRGESQKLQRQALDLEAKADAAEKAGKAAEAEEFRTQAAELHSEPLQVEMTFTVYRTTKGRVGEPVYAQIEVNNLNPRVSQPPFRNIFPIREYYTNKQLIPASYLVGSNGAIKVEILCISPTQYLGMAESDLYILQQKGNFGLNFLKGLFGIWLQAMVLTAIGVFAGTFLSWPMALLTTIAFYIAGQVAFSFFRDIAFQSLVGGGPFESLIRLVTHDNQMTELSATPAVVVAKTLDALIMPLLSRLAYIVPNFGALDVTNTVAEGFAVEWSTLLDNTLLALAYALPFSIGGYFILKNREVAA